MEDDLLRLLREAFPSKGYASVANLASIGGGWETEIHSFTTEYREAGETRRQDLILRIYPGADAEVKSAREFRGMRRLYEAGYPVPRVWLWAASNTPIGRPFVIMDKIDGQLLSAVLAASSPEKKQQYLGQFCRLLVDLQNLDWRPFAADLDASPAAEPRAVVGGKLSQAQTLLHGLGKREYDPVFDWLLERIDAVTWSGLSLTHWDYHPWNVLVRDDGATFVIDWGGLEVFDPRFDLAWTLLLVGAYCGPNVRETVLQEYQRLTGGPVRDLAYFEVAACLRRLFGISVSLSDGADKLGMRPGAEALMRQNGGHIRQVYAVLQDRTGLVIPEIEHLVGALAAV